MCITFFQLQPNSHFRFIFAFNRDEFANRETTPFSNFEDDPNIFAGRDVVAGGTWLGFNIKTGLLVILTNYRKFCGKNGVSRGLLVKHFLSSNFTDGLANGQEELNGKIWKEMSLILKGETVYSPHNLAVYNIRGNKVFYMCSEINMTAPLILPSDQVCGFSNTDIFTKWRKVEHGKELFNEVMKEIQQNESITDNEIFERLEKVMKNRESKCCSKILEKSIFIEKYFSLIFRRTRMTKSTFYAIFKADEFGNFEAHIKEVTYSGKEKGENIIVQKKIKIDK